MLEKYVVPMLTHYAVVRLHLHSLNFNIFELKIGTPVTPALGNVHTNFGFSTPF